MDATSPLVKVGPATSSDLVAGSSREWLLADGLGGYATGTVSGLRTRRYHGLLTVATHRGEPVGPGGGVAERHLALASLDPVLVLGDRRVRLATHEWADGAVDPPGHTFLAGVELRPGSVAHRWVVGDVVVEREVAMMHGRPVVAVRHRVVRAPRPVLLEVAALGTWRDHHASRRVGDGEPPRIQPVAGGAVVEDRWRISGPGFVPSGIAFLGVRHREEAARGLDPTDDLWHVGTFVATLDPLARNGSGCLDVLAWADEDAYLAAAPPPVAEVLRAARSRAATLLHTAGDAPSDAVAGPRCEQARRALVLAADAFVTTAPGVVAGYPWFGEWSRDTLTSYEGLFLATGRHAEGAALLRRYAGTLSAGMLANTADSGAAEYNTVDATPWLLHAVARHVDVTADAGLLADVGPALVDAVRAHVAGTRFGIGVDPADGLVRCGGPGHEGVALTWQDARVDGVPVTPRHGKPVEVNALWVAGLTGLARLLPTARAATADVDLVTRLAAGARTGFRRYADAATGRAPDGAGGLLDVLDPDDATTRANQVLAAALPDGPLAGDPAAAAAVTAAVAPLVTPLGLRTLPPDAAGFTAHYGGPPATRDHGYHTGTVWPWLAGPYVAALRAAGQPVDGVLDGLVGHLAEAGLGSVSEVADGAPPHTPGGCPFQAWSVAQLLAALSPSAAPR